jgi:hypothetical protein
MKKITKITIGMLLISSAFAQKKLWEISLPIRPDCAINSVNSNTDKTGTTAIIYRQNSKEFSNYNYLGGLLEERIIVIGVNGKIIINEILPASIGQSWYFNSSSYNCIMLTPGSTVDIRGAGTCYVINIKGKNITRKVIRPTDINPSTAAPIERDFQQSLGAFQGWLEKEKLNPVAPLVIPPPYPSAKETTYLYPIINKVSLWRAY